MKRLFEFNDTDTVIAVSEKAARKFYQEITGFTDEEMAEISIEEIYVDKWQHRKVITDEYEEGKSEPIVFTLAQWVEQFNENEPMIICSTEC